MAYDFYLDGVLLPVPPSKLQVKIKNQNRTITLINEGEVNLLKQSGLTDVTLTVLLPQVKHQFASYPNGVFLRADHYLEKLEQLKADKKLFQFLVSRYLPSHNGNGIRLFDTNLLVSLEEYRTAEDAENGFDVMADITLKQYREFGTKIKPPEDEAVKKQREARNAPDAKTHKVVKGDTLWALAKKYYGNGSLYTKIHQANKNKMKSPNLIHIGQVLTIP